jgi:hypothetical protein
MCLLNAEESANYYCIVTNGHGQQARGQFMILTYFLLGGEQHFWSSSLVILSLHLWIAVFALR